MRDVTFMLLSFDRKIMHYIVMSVKCPILTPFSYSIIDYNLDIV